MKKKILLSLVAMVAVAGGIAAMSAFEAHIINVTAHIENALSVHPTELVFIKGVRDKNEIKNGDIIVYKNYQGFTIHRVMAINDDTLVTKGDANNIFDLPINVNEVVGKALSVKEKPIRIPFVGEINIFIKYIKDKL